jgi:hypothetical protein
VTIIEIFKEVEERKLWEPKVKRIKNMISPEEFVINILKEVFYRGFGEYYFNQKCELYMKLMDEGAMKRANQIEKELFDWKRTWYGKHKTAKNEALYLIEEIEEKLEKRHKKEKSKFSDDKDNPEVEVWKWVLTVPW